MRVSLSSIHFPRLDYASLNAESQRLLWAIGALSLAMLPHLDTIPMWVPLLAACVTVWRIVIELRAWRLPPRWLRITIAFGVLIGVAGSYRTLNGLEAGTALLVAMAGVKLLETRGARDYTILIFIGYVLLFAALLYRQELFRAPYILLTAWILTATLLRIHQTARTVATRTALRNTGVIVLQAVPVAILLFLFFPRLSGQFWALPAREQATTGLSDEMTPGDIAELTISGAPAFRVKFSGPLPPPSERYWRGPVMHNFDGRRWRLDRMQFLPRQELRVMGDPYTYRITMEPTQQPWLLALDVPTEWPGRQVMRSPEWQLFTRRPISTLASFDLVSYTRFEVLGDLPRTTRNTNTSLPGTANPRTRAFGQELRAQTESDAAFVQAVLAKFNREKFFYTLQPPSLGDHPADEFLFDTKKGFCEHFASAFTVLVRAAGIPARVVTGYQGGEYNEMGEYLLVRQSDAHAWSEVWLEGQGWVRVDPTAAVAPERIERNLSSAMGADEPVPGRLIQSVALLSSARQAWDALNNFWYDRIVEYNELQQKSLLEWLGVKDPDWRDLGIAFAATLLVFFVAMSVYLAYQFRPRHREPVQRAYDALCRKLAKQSLPRHPHEGPDDYLNRVAQARPELAATLTTLRELYLGLRYGPAPDESQLRQFIQTVKQV
jgi:transglutaminase-like putative cysteine protease